MPALQYCEQHKHSGDMGPIQILGTSINHLVRREELAKITGGFPALLTQECLDGFGINGLLAEPIWVLGGEEAALGTCLFSLPRRCAEGA